jgi:hypothetical protein
MKIQSGVTKSIPVEYVLVERENLIEVAKWCNGSVAGLSGIEYCTEGLMQASVWHRVGIGRYLLKAEGGFMDYTLAELERFIDASPDK